MEPIKTRFLFVCGTPCSANAEVHSILTQDQRIVLGLNRFSSYSVSEIIPTLFNKDNFLNFEKDVRDHNKKIPYYSSLNSEAFDALNYIGDQLPYLYNSVNLIHNNFPQFKLIIILRNVNEICRYLSYQFPTLKDTDFERIALNWNKLLELVKSKGLNGQYKVIFYEKFLNDISQLEKVYHFLNLDLTVDLRKKYHLITNEIKK
jgi:hypothetical protein